MKKAVCIVVAVFFFCFSIVPSVAGERVSVKSWLFGNNKVSLFSKEYDIALIGSDKPLQTNGFVFFLENSEGRRLWQRTYGDLKVIPQDRPRDFHALIIAGRVFFVFVEAFRVHFNFISLNSSLKPIETDAVVKLAEIRIENPDLSESVIPFRSLIKDGDFYLKLAADPPRIKSVLQVGEGVELKVSFAHELFTLSLPSPTSNWSVLERKSNPK